MRQLSKWFKIKHYKPQNGDSLCGKLPSEVYLENTSDIFFSLLILESILLIYWILLTKMKWKSFKMPNILVPYWWFIDWLVDWFNCIYLCMLVSLTFTLPLLLSSTHSEFIFNSNKYLITLLNVFWRDLSFIFCYNDVMANFTFDLANIDFISGYFIKKNCQIFFLYIIIYKKYIKVNIGLSLSASISIVVHL